MPNTGQFDGYRIRSALLTDLYQLTMAYGYWKNGLHKRRAVFHLFYRRNPFGGGYAVACGMADILTFIKNFRFLPEELAYLAGLTGNDDTPLFEAAFLDHLGAMRLTCDIAGVPEGSIVFPFEPLLRVTGSVIQCQLLETALLNMINFPTLIATRAARVCEAAQKDPVLEFGLRRAQGRDGGLAASRAAYIGGCTGTSNVLAGMMYDIPVKGTHAHSWVMTYDDEEQSFREYARAMPNNCVFLVDTYDTVQGVRNAIKIGLEMKSQGRRMIGIRLDSGDLAYLSLTAREMLDEAGFQDAVIIASNDLDEKVIASLKAQSAAIAVWGVGTRLVTAYDQPALDGVYKLTAMQDAAGQWRPRIKLSEQTIKIPIPGVLQVRRFHHEGQFCGDMIYDAELGIQQDRLLIDRTDATRRKRIPEDADFEDLLVPLFKDGAQIYESPDIHAIRDHARSQHRMLHAGIRRFVHPHEYPVGLEINVHERMTTLIKRFRLHGSRQPSSGERDDE